LTSMHMTLLGALLALTPRALYAGHGSAGSGIGAVEDQHLGGAIMLIVGGVSYLAGALVLMGEWLRAPGRSRVPPSGARGRGRREVES
jgi:putative membrane protein